MKDKSEALKKDNLVSIKDAYINVEEKVLDPDKLDLSSFERLPSPTGWRILILPYRGKGKTEGGVFLPDAIVDRESIATVLSLIHISEPTRPY